MSSDHLVGTTKLDEETGEVDQTVICLKSTALTCSKWQPPPPRDHSDRSRFRIPSAAQVSKEKQCIQVHRGLQINGVDLTVLNTQHLSPIALVLPTLLLFPAWAAIACALGEASIHIWSHKRNKCKKSDEKLFRSPLNLISSEFCAKCRTEKWMKKIGNIQDKRSMRRNLIHPSFIKQVIR